MKKSDLIKTLAEKFDTTQAGAKEMLEKFELTILELLESGEEVPFLGKFKVKEAPQRNARNPKTGEPVVVEARKKLTYKPSKEVKATIK